MQDPKLVQRANSPNWNVRYYNENGQRKFLSTGTTDKKLALGVLADFIKHDERERLHVAPSVFECLDYYDRHKKIKGTYKIIKDQNIIDFFGQMPANTISIKLCRNYISLRSSSKFKRKGWKSAKPISEQSAGRELRSLRAAVNFCVNESFCPNGSVFYIPSIQSKGRDYLTKQQARIVFDACPTFHVKLFMMIALQSGHRMSAILDLTWDRVTAGHINFIDPNREQTNKRRGRVPIIEGSELYTMLSEARAGAQTKFVIEHNDKGLKSIRHSVHQAGLRVGIDYLNPHILKHTACIWMAENEVPLADIADLTCTNIETIMENYMIFTPARGNRAVAATQF